MDTISIATPLSRAWSRMILVLFQPFELVKWLKLGFAAWLATLGQGGGYHGSPGGGSGGSSSGSGSGGRGPLDEIASGVEPVWSWAQDHLAPLIALALVLILVLASVALLLGWIKARGEFMLLDGIIRNRGAIREPWRAYGRHGNSLFLTRLVLSALGLGCGALILGAAVLVAWGDIAARSAGAATVAAIAGGVLLLAVVGVVLGVAGWILNQLVVPAMIALDAPFRAAWPQVRTRILVPHLGTIALYWLARLGVGLLVGMAAAVVTLLTCCVATLPYVGAVILLPATVLMRAWSLAFVEQFGEAFRVFPREDGSRAQLPTGA